MVVLIDQPLRKILHNPGASGRLVNWFVELGEFDIRYQPCPAIKAQALDDFVVECTVSDDEPDNQEVSKQKKGEVLKQVEEYWTLYVDGASNSKGNGARLILSSPEGFSIEYPSPQFCGYQK